MKMHEAQMSQNKSENKFAKFDLIFTKFQVVEGWDNFTNNCT